MIGDQRVDRFTEVFGRFVVTTLVALYWAAKAVTTNRKHAAHFREFLLEAGRIAVSQSLNLSIF